MVTVKNTSVVVVSDKYNLKPIPLKCQHNTQCHQRDLIILPQPMESLGFLDVLNSSSVPGIKIKKKVLSPTAAKVRVLGSRYRGQVEKVQGKEGPSSVECWGRQEALSQT